MKYSGLVPKTVAVNAVIASCKIILLFCNFGSGVYVVILGLSSVTACCCGGTIRPILTFGVFAIGVACTGLCTSECV